MSRSLKNKLVGGSRRGRGGKKMDDPVKNKVEKKTNRSTRLDRALHSGN